MPFSFIRYSGIVQRNNNNRKTCNYVVLIILINTTEISVEPLVSRQGKYIEKCIYIDHFKFSEFDSIVKKSRSIKNLQ